MGNGTARAERGRVLQEGLYLGLIGYVTVAIVVGIVDLAMGRAFFYTPAVLGGALFGSGGAVAVTPEIVFPFNGVHLLVFLGIGFLVAFLVHEVELHPVIWYFVFFALLGLFFVSLFVIDALGQAAGPGIPWISVLAANTVAAFAMGWYLHLSHRGLWAEMRRQTDPEASRPSND